MRRSRLQLKPPFALVWDRFIGLDGIFVGMTGFGASGPIEALYKHFGITADAIVAAAESKLK